MPWRHLSFDLETSVEHDVILCAVAWAEVPGPTGMVRSATRFSEDEASIMKGLTSLVRYGRILTSSLGTTSRTSISLVSRTGRGSTSGAVIGKGCRSTSVGGEGLG